MFLILQEHKSETLISLIFLVFLNFVWERDKFVP